MLRSILGTENEEDSQDQDCHGHGEEYNNNDGEHGGKGNAAFVSGSW